MSAQLLRWIGAGGDRRDGGDANGSLEQCAADGFAVASILAKYGLVRATQLKKFKRAEQENTAALLEIAASNFEKLEPILEEKLGLVLTRKEIANVMLEVPGAAAQMLFKLKCKLEPDAAPPEDSLLSLEEKSRKDREAAVLNIRESPRRVPVPDPNLELAARGLLNKKQLDSALHLAHFEERRIERQLAADDEARAEHKDLCEARAERRKSRLERLAESRAFLDAWIEQGKRDWRMNERVKAERIRRELQFELTCRASEAAKAEALRAENTKLVQRGTEEFERNLKRLGVDTGDSSGTGTAAALAKTELQSRAALEAKVEDMMARNKAEVAKHLAGIRAQREESLAGRKAREQRRRKMLSDQEKAQRTLEADLAREALLQKVQEEAEQERKAASERKRQAYKSKMSRADRRRRARELIAYREGEFRAQVLAHQHHLEQKALQHAQDPEVLEATTNLAMIREERLTKEADARAIRHDLVARETLELIVGLVERVVDAKDASSDARIAPAEWRELKVAFAAGQTLPAPIADEGESPFQCSAQEAAFAETDSPFAKEVTQILQLDAESPGDSIADVLQGVCRDPATLPQLRAPFKCAAFVGLDEAPMTRFWSAILKQRYGCRIVRASDYEREAETQRAEDEANEVETAPAKVPKKPLPIEEENRSELLRRVSHAKDNEATALSAALTRLAVFDLATTSDKDAAIGVVLIGIAQTLADFQAIEDICGPLYQDVAMQCEREGDKDIAAFDQKSESKVAEDDGNEVAVQDGELESEPTPGFLNLLIFPQEESLAVEEKDESDEKSEAEDQVQDPSIAERNEWAAMSGIHVCTNIKDLEASFAPPPLTGWAVGQRLLLLHSIAENGGPQDGRIDVDAVHEALQEWEKAKESFVMFARPALHRAMCSNEETRKAATELVAEACALVRGEQALPGEKRSMVDEELRQLKDVMHTAPKYRPSVEQLAHGLWESALDHTRRTRAHLAERWEDNATVPTPRSRWLENVALRYAPVLKLVLEYLSRERALINRVHEVMGLERIPSPGALDKEAMRAVEEALSHSRCELSDMSRGMLDEGFQQAMRAVELRALDNPISAKHIYKSETFEHVLFVKLH
ncbi:Reticulocyte-binding protein 2-like a [Hondaea fermentalgiana]|uniref:Reticulocyte-binding protein 2-like a n=1 Tax=Hondaea fermentalgiana TaxID=2315210 RepID=A0A2R5G045_9STRA|nr:Reticulocyte-binding protein 2-like a [Hondaea fermentalgiana]|eukprot:GBG23895.1 Reticulocyte-binding protein 2-like a [Hondaea fermentalgiana]